MYAVFETGGKQYRVTPGDTVRVEKIDGSVGQTIEFNRVLLINEDENMRTGKPFLQGARVVARIVNQDKGPKIRVFKMKRRKGYRRTVGHRQHYTGLRIQEIRA